MIFNESSLSHENNLVPKPPLSSNPAIKSTVYIVIGNMELRLDSSVEDLEDPYTAHNSGLGYLIGTVLTVFWYTVYAPMYAPLQLASFAATFLRVQDPKRRPKYARIARQTQRATRASQSPVTSHKFISQRSGSGGSGSGSDIKAPKSLQTPFAYRLRGRGGNQPISSYK